MSREKYGLTEKQIRQVKLPTASYLVEIYEVSKITNSKSKMSIVEKINHLLKLQEALEHKLELMKTKKIPCAKKYPHQLHHMTGATTITGGSSASAIEVASGSLIDKLSDIDEDEHLDDDQPQQKIKLKGAPADKNLSEAEDQELDEEVKPRALDKRRKVID